MQGRLRNTAIVIRKIDHLQVKLCILWLITPWNVDILPNNERKLVTSLDIMQFFVVSNVPGLEETKRHSVITIYKVTIRANWCSLRMDV